MTTSKQHYREGYAPLLPGVHVLPYPPAHGADPVAVMAATRLALDELFGRVGPRQIGAIFVEPVLGEGGYVVPPPAFLALLREVTAEHGILLVADEVQSGIGRTGRWFAFEHTGIVPDVVLSAKAIASGLPLSAIIGRRDLMQAWPPASHGSTFGGNPVCCAAALATIDVIAEEGLVSRAEVLGARALEHLRREIGEHPAVVEVRGLGLMIGLELRAHRGWTTAASAQERVRVICQEANLLLISCGINDEVIRLIPPLNIAEADLDQGLDTIVSAVRSL